MQTSAIANVTGEKGLDYDFPPDGSTVTWERGSPEIFFGEGTVSTFDEEEPLDVLKPAGFLNLRLTENFGSFEIILTRVLFSFLDGSEDDLAPNVRLKIMRQGELPPLVEIENENTMVLKLRIPEGAGPLPLSNALAGNIVFVTRPQFRGSQITFTEATFTTIDPGANGETPAKAAFASETIMPNVVLDIRSFVTDVPVPTVRPVTEAVTDTRAIIKGEFNKPGIITILYGTDPANLDLSVESISEITRFRLALQGLTPRTRYFFQAKSLGAQGESGLAPLDPSAFVTRDLDNTPPRILKGPGIFGRTPTSAKIGFELNEAATSEIAYGTAPDALDATASGPADPTRIHSVRVSGLTPGEETFFQVTVTDLNSNQGQSPVLRFRPLLVADTRPPRDPRKALRFRFL